MAADVWCVARPFLPQLLPQPADSPGCWRDHGPGYQRGGRELGKLATTAVERLAVAVIAELEAARTR
jgi:hypothetical protein